MQSSYESDELRWRIDALKARLIAYRAANPDDPNTKIYYDLIEKVVHQTEQVLVNRSSSWSQTFQKATFKRDKEATLGVTSSFSVADSLTNVPDSELANGLSVIEKMMDPAYIDTEHLTELKKFSDRLPSSEYKQSIDSIYQASLFCALAMVTMMFPPLLPFTTPALTALGLVAGSLIMGLACHITMKVFFNHAAEEVYENQHFKLLQSISSMPADEAPITDKADLLKIANYIKDQKDSKKISAEEAAKGLKIINRAMKRDLQAIEQLETLEKSMKFSIFKDAPDLLKDAFKIAFTKYRTFAVVMSVAVVAQVGLAVISNSFLVQLLLSGAIGAGAVAGYEGAISVAEEVYKTELVRMEKNIENIGGVIDSEVKDFVVTDDCKAKRDLLVDQVQSIKSKKESGEISALDASKALKSINSAFEAHKSLDDLKTIITTPVKSSSAIDHMNFVNEMVKSTMKQSVVLAIAIYAGCKEALATMSSPTKLFTLGAAVMKFVVNSMLSLMNATVKMASSLFSAGLSAVKDLIIKKEASSAELEEQQSKSQPTTAFKGKLKDIFKSLPSHNKEVNASSDATLVNAPTRSLGNT